MNEHFRRTGLIITFILIGFVALIAQTIFVREFLVIFFGNEISLGIIFAAWFVGITMGAWIMALVVDRLKQHLPLFLILVILITLILPIQIYLVRIARGFLDISIGEPIPFIPVIYLSLFLIIPYSILIGFIFPVACKIYTTPPSPSPLPRGGEGKGEGDPAIQIGWVYVAEAFGGLLGGVIFTFYLVGHFHSFKIVALSNILLLIFAFLLSLSFTSFIRRISFASAILVLLILYLIGFFYKADTVNQASILARWQTFSPMKMVENIDSKYENLTISQYQDQYALFGNGQLVVDFPDEYQYEPLAHFFLCQHPQPANVLLIGGGAEGLLKHILKHPVKSLHYVQLDPQAIELVAKYLPGADRKLITENTDSRLYIYYTDGRYFVKHSPIRFDLVILNLPDPATAMINRFYTVDFFQEVKSILTPGGVVVSGITSAANYFNDTVGNYVGSVYDTLQSVFPYVLVTPGDYAWFFASSEPDVVTFDIGRLDKRYQARQISAQYFQSPYSFELFLPEGRVKFMEKALKDRKKHYLNTDLAPVSYFFNLVLWDTVSRGARFFQTLARVKFGWLIGFLIMILIARFGYVWRKRGHRLAHYRTNALFAILSIGFAGLALELVLLFSFQNIYGYIYQKIGLIIAFFMVGLAVGGIIANKCIMNRPRNWSVILALINGGVILLAVSLPFLLSVISAQAVSELLFMILIVFSGILTGLVYPLANKLYIESGGAVGRAAGLIDSADHLGACLGAILTGIMFIPLFGIHQTCWFVAAFNLVSLLYLVLIPRIIGNHRSTPPVAR